jgi:aspartate kinase
MENISLIATVGHGMTRRMGTAATLFKALADEGINIKMIDQGSSELNIIIGVNNTDYEKCIRAIFKAFN